MPGTPRKKATIAGPRTKKAVVKTSVAELDRMQAVIWESLDEDKAEDIVAIDLAGRASFADRMVIATGLADRQISAMATHLNEKLVEAGFKKVRLEGANGTDWVL
ncbi:MAG TPA: ribosome silencing factor, partial [Acidocella sp.]|nr:ribosome silencing factor [Acidocella sp.]